MQSLSSSNSSSKSFSFFSSDSNEFDRNCMTECLDSILDKSFFSSLLKCSTVLFFSSSLICLCSASNCSSINLPRSSKACFLRCCFSLLSYSSCFCKFSICSSIYFSVAISFYKILEEEKLRKSKISIGCKYAEEGGNRVKAWCSMRKKGVSRV